MIMLKYQLQDNRRLKEWVVRDDIMKRKIKKEKQCAINVHEYNNQIHHQTALLKTLLT